MPGPEFFASFLVFDSDFTSSSSDVSEDSLSDSDAVSGKDAEDAGSAKPSSSSSHLRDLNAHFDDVADEVWVTLGCFDCLIDRLLDCTVP